MEEIRIEVNGEKVGVAVWGGQRCGEVQIGWSCYDLSDHFVGEVLVLSHAADLLTGRDCVAVGGLR